MQGSFNVDWENVLDNTNLDEETSLLYETQRKASGPVARKRKGGGKKRGVPTGRLNGAAASRGRAPSPAPDAGDVDAEGSNYADAESGDDVESEPEAPEDTESGDDVESEPEAAEDTGVRGNDRKKQRGGGAQANAVDRKPHPAEQHFMMGGWKIFVMDGNFGLVHGQFGHYIKPFTVDDDWECVPFPPPDHFNPEHAKDDADSVIPAGFPGLMWPSERLVNAVWDRWERKEFPLIEGTDAQVIATLQRLNPMERDINELFLKAWKTVDMNTAPAPFVILRSDFLENPDKKDENPLYYNGPNHRDPNLPPNLDWAIKDVDFVACASVRELPRFLEIGREFLKNVVQKGEELDLAFAYKMQGLIGGTLDSVWACLDPSFNPADRRDMLNRFSAGYISTFFKSVSWEDQEDSRAVATEELQQHKAFCQEWVHKHYRTLTPLVTAAAEALVLEFYSDVKGRMHENSRLDVRQYARMLMRDPVLSHPFAVCLQSYMTSIDQARPGRNASYKVLTSTAMARFQAFTRFTKDLEAERGRLAAFYETIRDSVNFYFHEYTVDWHAIAGQLPEVHRHFERPRESAVRRRLKGSMADRVPWLYGRN